MTTKNFTIYQITEKSARRAYGFESYDFAKEHGFDFTDYTAMWTGETYGANDTEMLENLFCEFNTNRPVNFTGHSLSVSDIVALDGTYYYCDSFGWEKISF